MLLKSADNKDYVVQELEALLVGATGDRKKQIEQDLRIQRAGIKAEKDSAYLIDFDYKERDAYVVIHDLRLEVGGRVAQIDHVLINRWLDCFVLETKSVRDGIKITEEGEFLRWNDYKKTYEGMASPLSQNERHISVLKEGFGLIEMPTRLGMRLKPAFHSYVLVSSDARIDRPKQFDTSQILKADGLRQALNARIDKEGIFEGLASMSKVVSPQTLQEIGRLVVSLHKPIRINVAAKYGAPQATPRPEPVAAAPQPVAAGRASGPLRADATSAVAEGPACKDCAGARGSIQYGKYGYYFKCGGCDANTSIKVACGQAGHKERIRKEGERFFRECADCGSSSLYFTNP